MVSRLRCPFFKIFRHGSTHIPGTVTLYSSTLGIDFWAWGGGFSRACVCLFDRLVSWLWRLVGWLIRWVRSERKKDETEPHLPPCRNLKHILIFTFCFIDFSVLPPCLGLEKRVGCRFFCVSCTLGWVVGWLVSELSGWLID